MSSYYISILPAYTRIKLSAKSEHAAKIETTQHHVSHLHPKRINLYETLNGHDRFVAWHDGQKWTDSGAGRCANEEVRA